MSDTGTAIVARAEPRTRSSGCEERLDAVPWTDQRWYRIGDRALTIRTTSPLFAHWVDGALPRAAHDGDPFTLYSAFVTRGAPGIRPVHTLYRGCGVLTRTDEFITMKRALLADIETLDHAARNDAIAVEAGIFFVNGHAVLAPSLLVMWLHAYGGGFAKDGVRFPESVRTAIDLSSGLTMPPSRRLASWSAFENETTPNIEEIPSQVRIDTIVSFSMASEQPVHEIPRGAALRQLASAASNLPMIGGQALKGLANLVSEARCIGIHPVRSRHAMRMLMTEIENRSR